MKRRILLALLPLLLLLLLPFRLPLSLIYHTLEPYGSLNPYLSALALGASGVLLFDAFLKEPQWVKKFADPLMAGLLVALSLAVRFLLFDFESNDYLGALSVWFEHIKSNGGFSALSSREFSDYNSLYLYMMALATYFPLHKLYSIKLISILFDYVGAWLVYKLVKRKDGRRTQSMVASVAFLFAPTVVLNGSLWAQCDVIYTTAILGALLLAIQERFPPKAVLACFSLGLMFKLQSVFFALPLMLFYVQGQIKLKHLWVIPAVWLGTILPHYLLGRDFADLLLIYPRQVVRYPQLALDAPSVYQLIPGAPYEMFYKAGIATALAAVVAFTWLSVKRVVVLEKGVAVRVALLSAMLLPFLLPKMHERYFFMADCLAIVYAFWVPKRWFVGLGMPLISMFCYLPYLFGTQAIGFTWLSLGVLFLLIVVIQELWTYLPTIKENSVQTG